MLNVALLKLAILSFAKFYFNSAN